MSTEVLYTPQRTLRRPPSRVPALKAIGYTLDISVRYLVHAAVGRAPLSYQAKLIESYWRRIFEAGNGSLTVVGREHIEPGAAYVVMSNHSSLLDIPALFGAFPGTLRMVTKEELTRIPVWGHALKHAGFVPIDRKDRAKAIGQLEVAKHNLRRGISVWIAPEGRRSRTRELGAFKKGGFHVALGLEAQILPAWVDGTQDIIRPDGFLVQYDGEVTVRFGAPIPTMGRAAHLEALMEEVRAAMLTLKDAARSAE